MIDKPHHSHTKPPDPAREEVEKFFLAAAIAVGMIYKTNDREGPRVREWFDFRAQALPSLPYIQIQSNGQWIRDSGLSTSHPMSIDNYVEWCIKRTEEVNHD